MEHLRSMNRRLRADAPWAHVKSPSRVPRLKVRFGFVFWVAAGIKVLLSANAEKAGKLSFTGSISWEAYLIY